ncbi:MAG TPA: hypothetical protein VK303_07795, partial [Desulfobacteria bacterium]|nr:hypothetical protein [Desulfobacteria bacterium]
MNGRVGKGISALLLLALLLVQAGCHWGGRGGTPPPAGPEEIAGDNTAPTAVPEAVAPAPKDRLAAPVPGWAKSPEELVYRVDFIGITMGYARFRYQG